MTLALGAFFEQHPLPHLVYDLRNLRLVAANPAAAAYYGHPVDRLVGMTRLDLLDPAQADDLRRFIRELPGSAAVQPQTVWRERAADGRRLYSDIRGVPWSVPAGDADADADADANASLRMMVVMDARPRTELLAASREQAGLFAVAERVGRVGGWRLDLATGKVMRTRVTWEVHGLEPPEADPLGEDRYVHLDGALDFYPPDARETVRAALEACRERGVPFDLELPFRNRHGKAMWVRSSGEPVRDAGGRVIALQGALQDITATKQAEIALRESRERLQATIRAMPDLWFVFDADNRYLDVSDPGHPSMSRDWPDKLGRRLGETVSPALAAQMLESIAIARRTGHVHAYLYEMAIRDQGARHFEARSVPLDGGRWMMLVRDVTETVHLERRFRLLAEALPVAIFESGVDGNTRWVNRQWQQLYGLSEQQALGTGWLAGIHPDDREAAQAGWSSAASGAGPYSRENRIVRPDGSVRSVRVETIPMVRADGELLGRIGVVVDTTEARELDEARRAREVAEEARRRQAAFLSRLSHELRTPLNAIIGFTELLILAEPPPDPPAPAEPPAQGATTRVSPSRGARLGYVRDAGKHMLALVDDLLELQRLQQSDAALRPEPVNLAEELQACAAMLNPLARSRSVRLEVSVDGSVPTAMADRRALRQVLLNLGSNAVKYGRVGGQVELRARTMGPSAGSSPEPTSGTADWLIEVQDEGEGLPPQALDRLFQPFERLGRERGDQPGSGLGLVISRQLAELMGGSLDLVSTPGAGTTARLRLPATG